MRYAGYLDAPAVFPPRGQRHRTNLRVKKVEKMKMRGAKIEGGVDLWFVLYFE